ncbi:GNAT family N-acetyltransferase [Amycolatopsis vastitatis]|uniref:N-acetyltransferase domain-containing protein n=1 Tax=Amycolatopsis vastitatis TaxID=1905142 RepID=A0A229SLK9_9PSEU|nr:GNAT family N-acetyltransferase [Amycolatopsis vastitatis]OXM59634.1 hypothetical protein CF165_46390 [Amycolatopsis vastitatis]
MTMPSRVEPLRPIDTVEAGAVKAGAFVDLAIARWLVPHDAAERERCLREQFAFVIRAALAGAGRLYGIRETGRLVATALWTVHPGGEPVDPPGYDAALRSITGPYYPRFRALDEVFAATTPIMPHHHLDLLASAERGRGLGSCLLSSYLSWADRRRPVRPMVALQAPRAAQLYVRHGFEADEPVEIPGSDGLHVFPMRRHPPAALPAAPASPASSNCEDCPLCPPTVTSPHAPSGARCRCCSPPCSPAQPRAGAATRSRSPPRRRPVPTTRGHILRLLVLGAAFLTIAAGSVTLLLLLAINLFNEITV